MKRILLLSSAIVLGLLTSARGDAQQGSIHSITLPNMPPNLPDGPNKEAVLSRCVLCHSARYITMQPAFSQKTWEAEVLKMKKNYGAPIPDEQVEDIVKYLVSMRGK